MNLLQFLDALQVNGIAVDWKRQDSEEANNLFRIHGPIRLMHCNGRYEKFGIIQLSEYNAHFKFVPRHRKVSVRDYFLKRDRILLEEPLARLVFLEGHPYEMFPPEILVPLWDNLPPIGALERHLVPAAVPVPVENPAAVPVPVETAIGPMEKAKKYVKEWKVQEKIELAREQSWKMRERMHIRKSWAVNLPSG